ncbi:MAG: C39 family peptidase [Gallionella sp.]|nr:C39 family peptidase [Gallionella sp.]
MIRLFMRLAIFVTCATWTMYAAAEHIGISKSSFEPHYRIQQTITWCWASSAEMVLSYSGIKLPQDAIVSRVRGAPFPGGGNPYEMINSTNGVFPDNDKKQVVVSGQMVMGAPTTAVLYNQLKHNRPVVLTYQTGPWSGHAVVLVAIDADVDAHGVNISRFYVFDPFPYRQQWTAYGPQFVEVPELRYQQLEVTATPMGLQLTRGGTIIGTLSGMILIDAVSK